MRICVTCGKTDDVVYFESRKRADGTTYHYKQCTSCVNKRKKRRREAVLAGTILQGRKGAIKRPKTGSVFILWCPGGEYARGNYFNNGEFKDTLNDGYWPLGMLVKIKEQKYAVCGSGVVARTWRQLDYPTNIEWTEQWLVEVNGRARV